MAKESKPEASKYAARSFAQAIATGHMRGHAMVCSDYAVKLVNISNNSSVAEAATKERERQLRIAEEMF